MKTNRWQRAGRVQPSGAGGVASVANEAETAASITQMMAVPKGNGHDRWQAAGGRGSQPSKLCGTMAF